MRLLGVVGLVSLDRVDGGLPRLGGAPYYSARALRLLGHPAVLVTKLAAEDSGRGLHALGVPVVSRPARATIAFRIENDVNGRSLEIEEPGEPWTPEEARGWVGEALAHADWVHAGALTREDFPAETLAALSRGRTLSLDGQGLTRPAKTGRVGLNADYDPALLRHVDVLKLSQEEVDALGVSLDERSLRSLGVREVVVTLGRKGSVVYADGLAEHIPTRALDVPDPTGAGDEFIAAYLSYRRRRHGPPSAARLASEVVHRLLSRA
ncbi:MAG TPA: carbohydrate kinase family protein [Gaiellaceae bacterium]